MARLSPYLSGGLGLGGEPDRSPCPAIFTTEIKPHRRAIFPVWYGKVPIIGSLGWAVSQSLKS